MMRNVSTLERAFQLAEAGHFQSMEALVEALRGEGYRDAVARTSGAYVQAQLHRALLQASERSSRLLRR